MVGINKIRALVVGDERRRGREHAGQAPPLNMGRMAAGAYYPLQDTLYRTVDDLDKGAGNDIPGGTASPGVGPLGADANNLQGERWPSAWGTPSLARSGRPPRSTGGICCSSPPLTRQRYGAAALLAVRFRLS